MNELNIDLSSIQFLDSAEPLFSGENLILKKVNFIFAKNGSGKSTLTDAIYKQKSDEYEVHSFKGFESILGINGKLDAFSLSDNADKNEAKIKILEQKKSILENQNIKISDSLSQSENPNFMNFYTKRKKAKEELSKKDNIRNRFLKDSATIIVDKNDPQLILNARKYNKTNFERDILKAEQLQDAEVLELKAILNANSSQLEKINFPMLNPKKYLESVNEIIQSKVEEKVKISRLNSQEKIVFAQEGLEIHKHDENKICSFCGNVIKQNVIKELESYFSADEVKALQTRISNGKKNIFELISKLNKLHYSSEDFLPTFLQDVDIQIKILDTQKNSLLTFFEELLKSLKAKEKNLFSISEPLSLSIPSSIDFNKFNILVDKNNIFSNDLSKKQDEAREKLLYHQVYLLLDERKYAAINNEKKLAEKLYELSKKDFDDENKKLIDLKKDIEIIDKEITSLKPKSEIEAIKRINSKLKHKVDWELAFFEDENSGYYQIKQGDVFRGVTKLSTGEKNIISFLYFVEKLAAIKETQDKTKSRIIIFDDPMSSNDDTMQYLIITELLKIYRGEYKDKFNNDQDFCVILTHNIHFYLNVQPIGNFKDNKGRTKYEKNNFYRIQNGTFIPIKNEKDDFKTSYASLWLELKDLYECGHKNSMLNSMRRIIETYIHFNSINIENFYKEKDIYKKLFDVNSHSIDDLSAETFTEDKDEMKELFKNIFFDNGADEHFLRYWPD